jgi:hypothetical protein
MVSSVGDTIPGYGETKQRFGWADKRQSDLTMVKVIAGSIFLLGLTACDPSHKLRERKLIADQLEAARQELAMREAHETEFLKRLEVHGNSRGLITFRDPATGKRYLGVGHNVAVRHEAEKQKIFELQITVAELERKLKAMEE